MAFDAHLRKYLKALQKEYKAAKQGGQHTAELSFRTPLHEMFKDISHDLNQDAKFDVILEPKNQGRMGRPDWRIQNHDTLGVYGYVEAKGPSSEPFDTTPYKNQINRYLTLKHKLVITDGIDFVFCFDEDPVVVSLIEKQNMNSPDWSRLAFDSRFKFYMEQFFSNPDPQFVDEEKLVELVAIRTRNLADDILRYADLSEDEATDEEERHVIQLLSGLKALVYNHNDSKLRNGTIFADFAAQVIMFCLLYAHRVLCTSADSPAEKESKIKEYIYGEITEGETLLPFRDLMLGLRNHVGQGAYIGRWIDECISFLSYVQMTDQQLLNPDYHRLFEMFLSKYDAKSRFDYGAYYTPKILADFVVRVVNAIVSKEFNGASIYGDENYIIDPCCGTGSFIEEVILHDTTDGAYNLCGFEILPAPYMLANYRMAVVEKQYGKRRMRSNILLANTLSNCMFGEAANDSSIEGRELIRANELSEKPLKLIIGNPPCSDSVRGNNTPDFSIINKLMEDFRPPVEERRSRQNIQKQINNPFMQFIRWSCKKLSESEEHSVLALVVPLSFLEAESYKYARKYLTEHFSKVWAIAIDADARTGVRSDSLFKTLQGRAVIILMKKFGDNGKVEKFQYADFSHGSRKEKEGSLAEDVSVLLARFSDNKISKNTYAFMPSRPFNEELYEKFWPVSDDNGKKAIFLNQCSGAKMAPTALLTHVKAPILKRRSREIAVGGIQAAKDWLDRQDKKVVDDKITAFQQALNTVSSTNELEQILSDSIRQCSFRPYVNSNVLLWDVAFEHIADVGGSGTRIRPEIRKMYDVEGTVGFALAHAPKDLSESLGQFASFCWYFPDNDLSRRGNGHIYLNQYVDFTEDKIINNVSPDLLSRIIAMTSLSEKECSRKMVFYSYAILCSQVYLDEFYGALFVVNQSDRRTRIPIVNESDIFLRIAMLGEEMAFLEQNNATPANTLGFDYDAIVEQLPSGFKLEHSKAAAKDPYDEENEELILRGEGTDVEIRIPCPLEIQKFTVSGYNVVKDCWLKFHSYRYTHCTFTKEDFIELLNLFNSLMTQTKLVASVDEIVHEIIAGNIELVDATKIDEGYLK